MTTTRSPQRGSAGPQTLILEFRGATTLGRYTTAVSLHAHTNRSREGMGVMPPYLDRIPIVAAMARRELRAYERRHNEAVDFARGSWHPPLEPRDVLASERSQIAGRLGLRPLVSITDHDSIAAPRVLQLSTPVDDVPLSFEWTVPFDRGFLHLGVHNLPRASGEAIFHALAAHTRRHDEGGLTGLLALLHEHPETLVVLNHPVWDLAAIGAEAHAVLVRRFLAEHASRIHAVEVNGYRSWSENAGAIRLAETAALPIISGGDRHGCAPNALLNLTTATSFGEFAREIRERRRSVVLVMPEYRRALVSRKLAVASDALREYPSHPQGQRRWTDRVTYDHEGETRRLSAVWPDGGPLWVRSATRLFAIATSAPLLPAVRLVVWLAGASTSRRQAPHVSIDVPVPPFASAVSHQETIR